MNAEKRKCLLVFFFSLFLSSFPLFSEVILTFEDAVYKTLALSPRLKIAGSEIDEKAGLTTQSGLYPNPVFGYSVENVFGNKNWHDFNAAESRYELLQLIELGGKRGYRYQTAKFQYYAAEANFDVKQLYILNKLLKQFSLVAALEENLKATLNQKEIANEVYQTVKAKVDAGKVSIIQQNKAIIELGNAKINLQNAYEDLAKAKLRLSNLWGSTCPDFDYVNFPFYEVNAPNSLDLCLFNLRNNPELLRSQMEYLAAAQNLKFEKSRAIPDVTVTVGVKTLRDTGNRGLIIGASIPIPVFNQNQGNIRQARAESLKTMEIYREREIALENKLIASHRDLSKAFQEIEKIESTVLKAALHSFELAKEGYREGKFEYLDMLDSQKTLFEVRLKYIQALLNYHQSLADIEYLNIGDEYS